MNKLLLAVSVVYWRTLDTSCCGSPIETLNEATFCGCTTAEPTQPLFYRYSLGELVEKMNFTSVYLITDQHSDSQRSLIGPLVNSDMFKVVKLVNLTNIASHVNSRWKPEMIKNRLYVIVCSIQCVTATLKLVSSEGPRSFLFYSHWLVVSGEVPHTHMVHHFQNLAVLVTNNFSQSTIPCNTSLELWTISNDERMFRNISLCNTVLSLTDVDRPKVYPNTITQLNGRTLKVGVAEWFPYMMMVQVGNSSELQGFTVTLWTEIGKILNFRIEWVYLPENGTHWEVLYEMLYNKEIELLGCPLLQSKERKLRMDFIVPAITHGVYKLFYRQPQAKDLRWRVVLETMSYPVLFIIILSLILTACVLGIFEGLSSKHFVTKESNCDKYSHLDRVKRKVWILFGNLLNQGQLQHCADASVSERTVLSGWCLFCLIISITFTAYLVPALGVSKPTVVFRTIQDLLNSRDYKWGVYGHGSFVPDYLRNSQSVELRRLQEGIDEFKKTDPGVFYNTMDDNVQKLLTEKYVFLESHRSMDRYMSNCNITFLDEHVMTLPAYLVTFRDSPFTELISHRLYVLFENGLIERWEKHWLQSRQCEVTMTDKSAVDMSYLHSILVLVTIGLSLSTITLFCEIFIKKRYKK